MLLGRLYGIDGCAHCAAALAYFEGAQVPVQPMSPAGDPVISEGLKKIQNREDFQVPTLVLFDESKEIIVGTNFERYRVAVDAYRARLSASRTDVPSAQSGSDRATPPAPIEVEVAPETVPVP